MGSGNSRRQIIQLKNKEGDDVVVHQLNLLLGNSHSMLELILKPQLVPFYLRFVYLFILKSELWRERQSGKDIPSAASLPTWL